MHLAFDPTYFLILSFSGYFNIQLALSSLIWGPRDLLAIMEHGPLICVSHQESALTFTHIIGQYLVMAKPQRAIAVLLSWESADQSFWALQQIVVYLLKMPLTEELTQQLKHALASFHSPVIPLSAETVHKYGSQVDIMVLHYVRHKPLTVRQNTSFWLVGFPILFDSLLTVHLLWFF